MAIPMKPRSKAVESDVVTNLRAFVKAGGPHEIVRVQRRCMGGCGRATAALVRIKWHVPDPNDPGGLHREEVVFLQLCARCLEAASVVLT